MKKTFTILFLTGFLQSIAQIEDSTKKDFFITGVVPKIDLFLPVESVASKYIKGMAASLEANLRKNNAFQIFCMYSAFESNQADKMTVEKTVQKTVQIIPQFKHFFSRKQNQGVYLGIYGKYSFQNNYYEIHEHFYTTTRGYVIKVASQSLGIGLLTGYELFIYRRINLDIFAGIGLRKQIKENVITGSEYYGVNENRTADGVLSISIGYKLWK